MTKKTEVSVIASGGFKAAYQELVPGFERANEFEVVTTWAGSVDIMKRMRAGDCFDLIIMPAASIEELIKLGIVAAGSRTDIAKSGIGIAVRAGSPRPQVGSSDALKRTLVDSTSIAYSTSASGAYVSGLFERMGIADAVKLKVKQSPPGVPVGELVARGEAQIGFQQISELLPLGGIDYLGPLPADIQHYTTFSAGLHSRATQPEAAKALVRFLRAPSAAPIIRKLGMEPS